MSAKSELTQPRPTFAIRKPERCWSRPINHSNPRQDWDKTDKNEEGEKGGEKGGRLS